MKNTHTKSRCDFKKANPEMNHRDAMNLNKLNGFMSCVACEHYL